MRKFALTGLALIAAVLTSMLGGATSAVAAQFPAVQSQAPQPGITVSVYALGFNQISCSAASACLGLGLAVNPKTLGTEFPLAWNGTAWRKLALPSPAKGATEADLTGVSCAREAKQPSCVAVGYYASKSGNPGMFAVAWTGGALRLLPAPRLAQGVAEGYLDALSCASARHCVAVGSGFTTKGGAFPLLFETWNGTSWTVKTKALPAVGDIPELNGISCATSADCVLVGALQGRNGKPSAYAARWNGASLRRLTVPVPAGIAWPTLAAVSCSSAASCAVTGLNFNTSNGSTGQAFIDVLRGGTWSRSKVSWPKGTTSTELLGVSCLSATWCIAAGSAGNHAAALAYDGTSWSAQHVQAPPKGYADDFGGISCVTGKSCVALGDTGPVKGNELNPLGALWHGKAWTLKVIPG